MEGTFNIGQEFIEVLAAPAWTKNMLSEIRNSLRTAQSIVQEANDASAVLEAIDQLRQDIGARDARLETFIAEQTKGKKKAQIQTFLAILLALFTWAVPASDVQSFTADTVGPIVETLLEKYADGTPEESYDIGK